MKTIRITIGDQTWEDAPVPRGRPEFSYSSAHGCIPAGLHLTLWGAGMIHSHDLPSLPIIAAVAYRHFIKVRKGLSEAIAEIDVISHSARVSDEDMQRMPFLETEESKADHAAIVWFQIADAAETALKAQGESDE